MKVLLVTKKTNQEILEDKVKLLKIADEDFLHRLEVSHNEHYEALRSLKELFKREGIQLTELKRGMNWPSEELFDFIVTLGGDGTLLSASHQMTLNKAPILAVRSSDESVGYLCSTHHKDLGQVITQLKNPQKHLIQLERLYAEVTKEADTKKEKPLRTPPILNDFLFANVNPAETTRYKITLGDKCEHHKSSGVWTSTPTGSTAAIGTIGGVKQKLSEKVFQFKTRELYPNSELFSLSGGLFDPDKEPLKITNYNNSALLAVDGQHGRVDLTIGDEIVFKRAAPLDVFQPISSL